MYGFGDYVIAFFSKGYNVDLVHEKAEKMFYTIPDAHYYEVFTQEQFKRIGCL